jgi:hypothetical protein
MTRMQQQTCDGFWRVARIGSHVIDRHNPRHVGRITRINWSTTARVHWNNGWMQDSIPLEDLWPVRAQEWIT